MPPRRIACYNFIGRCLTERVFANGLQKLLPNRSGQNTNRRFPRRICFYMCSAGVLPKADSKTACKNCCRSGPAKIQTQGLLEELLVIILLAGVLPKGDLKTTCKSCCRNGPAKIRTEGLLEELAFKFCCAGILPEGIFKRLTKHGCRAGPAKILTTTGPFEPPKSARKVTPAAD